MDTIPGIVAPNNTVVPCEEFYVRVVKGTPRFRKTSRTLTVRKSWDSEDKRPSHGSKPKLYRFHGTVTNDANIEGAIYAYTKDATNWNDAWLDVLWNYWNVIAGHQDQVLLSFKFWSAERRRMRVGGKRVVMYLPVV